MISALAMMLMTAFLIPKYAILGTLGLLVPAAFIVVPVFSSWAAVTLITILFSALGAYSWHSRPVNPRERDLAEPPAAASRFISYITLPFRLIFDSENVVREILSKFQGSPVYLALPGRSVYFATPGAQIESLFRGSTHLLPTPSLFDAAKTLFGLPKKDFWIFEEHSALNGRQDPSRVLIAHQRKDIATYLQGKHLNCLIQKFLDCLFSQLESKNDKDAYFYVPDLYHYMTRRIFRAEVQALYGENIFAVCPTICEDFWRFYESLPALSRRLPHWLSPKSYAAQQKMLDNFKIWQQWCVSNEPENSAPTLDTEPDTVWGTLYIRRIYNNHKERGFSEDGIATVMLGYLFVTVGNSIPASVWMILNIYLDKALIPRLEEEVCGFFQHDTGHLQMSKLLRAPLLNSVCNETLRLQVASIVGRTALSDFNLSRCWKIASGTPVYFANWVGALDSSYWNTGRVNAERVPEHPVDKFWAERFLQYPDDPLSGPLRKPETSEISRPTEPGPERDKLAVAITNGLQSHWFPFGGGAYRCPGENLARQAMLAATALVVSTHTITFQDPLGAAATKARHRRLPFGSHGFDRRVPVQIGKKTMV